MFLAWRNVPTCVTRAWLPETIEMKCFNSWRPTFTFLIFSKSVKIENIDGDFAGLIWKVQNLSNMIMLQELSTTSCRNYFIAWNTKLSRHVYGRLQITKRSHRLKKVKIRCTKREINLQPSFFRLDLMFLQVMKISVLSFKLPGLPQNWKSPLEEINIRDLHNFNLNSHSILKSLIVLVSWLNGIQDLSLKCLGFL